MKIKIILCLGLIFIILGTFLAPVNAKADKRIEYQVDAAYPPFTYTRDGNIYGFDLAFGYLIFDTGDYEVNYSSAGWETVYSNLTMGRIDTCGLLAVTEERKAHLLYTVPVLKTHVAVFTKSSSPPIRLEDLKNYKVGVGAGYYTEKLLGGIIGTSTYYPYTDLEKMVYDLAEGKIDAIFENQDVINYYLIKTGLQETIVPQVTNLYPVEFAYGISKSNPDLMQYMNRRIMALQASGIYEQLYQNYFFKHSDYYNDMQRKKNIAMIIILAFSTICAALIIRYYIQYLNKKIGTATEELKQQHEWLRVTLSSIGEGVIATDVNGLVVFINQIAMDLIGITEEEALGRPVREIFNIINEDTAEPAQIPVERVIQDGVIVGLANHTALISRNGAVYSITDSAAPIRNDSNETIGVVMVFQDVTERKKTEKLQEIIYKIAESASSTYDLETFFGYIHKVLGSVLNTKNFYIALCDEENQQLHFPYHVDENFPELGHKASTSRRYRKGLTEFVIRIGKPLLLDEHSITNLAAAAEIEIIGPLPFLWLGTPLKIENKVVGVMAVQAYAKSVTYTRRELELMEFVSNQIAVTIERKRAEETINHLAYYDALTDLPNRVMFISKLDQALADACSRDGMLAVLFLDMDRFKNINDTLGHSYGDQLLQRAARRLTECLRKEDLIARLGGDEFTILIPQLKREGDTAKIAQKILNSLNKPFQFMGYDFNITTSIGISIYPRDGEDAQNLLKNADTALYRAKENGRNNYQLYSPSMNASSLKRLSLENRLLHALEHNEFILYYQPKFSVETGHVVGMEALIRWMHPELGLVPPDDFIPLAEETGLIIRIDEWVIRTACRQNKAWQDQGYPRLQMAVNISARQFQHSNLLEIVHKALNDSGLKPQYLELELTEGIVMQNAEYTIIVLQKLKQMGVAIALDDFGTGYSSLGYLQRFPIDTLKIDKSFMYEITNGANHAPIITAVIALARNLDCKAIAEGVETEEALKFLKENRCAEAQGYLFSRPVPCDEFERFLTSC